MTGTSATLYPFRYDLAVNSSQKLYLEYLTVLAMLAAVSRLINRKALVTSRHLTRKNVRSISRNPVERKTLRADSALSFRWPITMSREEEDCIFFQSAWKSAGSYCPSESMNNT